MARRPGRIRLTASAAGLPDTEVIAETVPCANPPLKPFVPVLRESGAFPATEDDFAPIPWADEIKYIPEAENYCKILVNGQEPDFRGVRAVNCNGSVWGNVLCVLDRMKQLAPEALDYD